MESKVHNYVKACGIKFHPTLMGHTGCSDEYSVMIIIRCGYRISVRGGGRDFLRTKLFSGIRKKLKKIGTKHIV